MTSETKDPPTDQIDRVWDHAIDSNRFLGAMVLVKLVMFLTFIFFSLPFYKTVHEGVLHPYDGGRPMPGMPMVGVVIVALGCTAVQFIVSISFTWVIFTGLLYISDGLRAVIDLIGPVGCQDDEENTSLLPDKKTKKNQQYNIV